MAEWTFQWGDLVFTARPAGVLDTHEANQDIRWRALYDVTVEAPGLGSITIQDEDLDRRHHSHGARNAAAHVMRELFSAAFQPDTFRDHHRMLNYKWIGPELVQHTIEFTDAIGLPAIEVAVDEATKPTESFSPKRTGEGPKEWGPYMGGKKDWAPEIRGIRRILRTTLLELIRKQRELSEFDGPDEKWPDYMAHETWNTDLFHDMVRRGAKIEALIELADKIGVDLEGLEDRADIYTEP